VSRFYVPKESVKDKTIVIEGDEAHHIIDVMRLKSSDEIIAFDGTGTEYVGTIKTVTKRSVVVDIVHTRAPSSKRGISITLIQAITKKAKMDFIVEKATELGVSAIIPVLTTRTIPDWDAAKKASCAVRWRKIVLEASKQCSRADIPAVSEVMDLKTVLQDAGRFGLALIATLNGEVVELRQAISGSKATSIVVAIGPEGDFTPEEVCAAKQVGFKPISLGSRVLKSDTAGLALLSVLDYELSI
jgi:16S rRNA (uracil1498-N3)-methyltransferase